MKALAFCLVLLTAGQPQITLTVTNDSWDRATVYRSCQGAHSRIGDVEAASRKSWPLAPCLRMRLVFRFFPGSRSEVTDELLISAGDTVRVSLTSHSAFWWVRDEP